MIYPKSPFCPFNDENAKKRNITCPVNDKQENRRNSSFWNDEMTESGNLSKCELMDIINQLEFAVTDLNLFLDTHPNDEEALKTFTMLAAALRSYKHDFVQEYGPLCATDSSADTPFDWVSGEFKWPWEA